MERIYDYIIIGSGSAGNALAYRLGADGKRRILVLEFGGSDAGPLIQMPAALSYPMNMSRYDWGYKAEPEPNLNNRSIVCPRGKVVGGSSSINGMVYIRGHAEDFNGWDNQGCNGWGYEDVLPYFIKMESYTGGDSEFRGYNGPLKIRRPKPNDPITLAFLDAGKEMGYPVTNDVNGFCQEGFGVFDSTIHKGNRFSSADAYLMPAQQRKNLTIITECHVKKIKFEVLRIQL